MPVLRLLLLSLTLTLTLASPMPLLSHSPPPPPPPPPPQPRAASASGVSVVSFADWPTDVVMLGGSQQFGLWVPPNAGWVSLCNVTCLDLPAYALGACCNPTVDAIGVASAAGTCNFVGITGWTAAVTAADGYLPVGPPQTIVSAKCSTAS